MFIKKSRYEKARTFEPTADGNGNGDGKPIFDGIRAREIGPTTGVIEHEVQTGDRLDLLARHYYNNDRAWWRIVDANPDFVFANHMLSLDIEGDVILIPKLRE